MTEWTYDVEQAQYYDEENQTYLDWLIALGWLWLAIDRTAPIAERLALLLVTESIATDAWEMQMRQILEEEYIQAHLLGRGGLEQMEPDDWDSITESLEEQNVHLAALALLAFGLTEAMLAYRSRLFVQSAQQAYWDGRATGEMVVGATEVRWNLNPSAESCIDCIELDSLGWQPIVSNPFGGAVPGSGDTQCLTNCRCDLEFRSGEA